MTIGPRTEREAIIAEASYLQGFDDGVRAITEKLRKQRLEALSVIDQNNPAKESA